MATKSDESVLQKAQSQIMKQSQSQKLLEYAQGIGWFSYLDAASALYIGHPWRSRKELEADGYEFEEREMEGESCKFKQFRLVRPKPKQTDLFTCIARCGHEPGLVRKP